MSCRPRSSRNPGTHIVVFYIGFAVSSNSAGNLSTATFDHVSFMTNVPQRSANLVMWLRSDVGVVSTAGQVSQWSDQSDNGNNGTQNTSGNKPSLVAGAVNGGSGSPQPPFGRQNYYAYDLASNRTAVQTTSTQTIRVGGTVTAGDTVTVTVVDPALTGGQQAVNYTVQGGDTLTTIAAGLAAAITANGNLQPIGVNATSNGTAAYVRSVSSNITTYTTSTSGGATETLTPGIYANGTANAAVSGTKTTGDILTITVFDTGLPGGQQAISYTVQASDTLTSIAAGLKNAINANTNLQSLGVTATSASSVVNIKSASTGVTNYVSSTSAGATETITLAINLNVVQIAAIGGTKTTGDVLTITAFDPALPGGSKAVNYIVQASDTLATIATGLASAITADANLQAVGVSATASGRLVSITSNSVNVTSYRKSANSGATETIALTVQMNGTQTAAIGGTKTTGDVLTITVHDSGLPGASKAVNYTVQAADTLATIAAGLAAAINADADLQAIGVTAGAVSTVVNVKSTSPDLTTYTQSISGGATETITLGVSTSVVQAAYNNVNALTTTSAGGATTFEGTTTKPVKFLTINTAPATLNWSQSFTVNAVLNQGTNTAAVQASDGANNTKTNSYQLSVNAATSRTFTHDANGNLTSDGTNSYQWDAENRLLQMNYPGTGNNTQISYDGLGHWVKMEERTSGSVTSTKQFVWCGTQLCEERDAGGAITRQFFDWGEKVGANTFFYEKDHLGNIVGVTDASGNEVAKVRYDAFGNPTVLSGSFTPSFGYAGYYYHTRSGLSLTMHRTYSPALARWLNRDPIEEKGGVNLYAYVGNNPINFTDPSGLQHPLLEKAFEYVQEEAPVVQQELGPWIQRGAAAAAGLLTGLLGGSSRLPAASADPKIVGPFSIIPNPAATNFEECAASCLERYGKLVRDCGQSQELPPALKRCLQRCDELFPPGPTGGQPVVPLKGRLKKAG